ncbi:hAT transposon superfamily [Thalictrum thalictroides]|uniref:HAT transposon superfamily n=1 Tax=Thalictrum thalictroides TaxID=46969 RepID=A0A7J6UT75_THATH|nr:hAT transposon superfamily [Thalictrum thalictroides]
MIINYRWWGLKSSSMPSPLVNAQTTKAPRATDLGWAHGLMVNGDRQKIESKYCHKVILGGGISRLKQHLAGERGNISPCEKVSEEVKAQMQQHLGFKVLQRLKKHKESEKVKKPLISSMQGNEDGNNDDAQRSPNTTPLINHGRRRKKEGSEASSGKRKRHKKQNIMFATPVNQRPAFISQESLDHADMAVAKFMYDAGIPFSAANSLYFQLMADAIAEVGPGYKMPSYDSLRGNLLNKSVEETGELCLELRKSWEVTGCSVMADRWTDRAGRTVINFYVYSSKGTMFFKSVDASEISKSSEALFNLFDSIVHDVGLKNIVHFVTDTTPNYKAAGKMLMSKYKTLFWSASAAHCIDLMLEELGYMDEMKEVLSKAKRVCQFIYNNDWLLNLMRKRTGGRDIVRPAITRCITSILTLQSIMSLKDPLHQMFTSTIWMQSDLSKQRAGLDVTDIVVDPVFWSSCGHVLKVTKPLLTVLHVADSEERPSMGYIYHALEKAKADIASAFNNKESEYFSYLKVIDHIWEEEFHSPLHAAAYYLNPSIFYNPGFSTCKLIQKGLLDCIETLEPNLTAQDMITRQITFYEDAVGDFSRPVALRGRESLAPATWWSLYAADYPDLQRFAVRILSQTCSGTQCERNLSMFERTHLKKKNRLEHDRLDNLIFVHYNLRLQERQSAVNKSMAKVVQDPTCLEEMDIDVSEWVEDLSSLDGDGLGWMDVAMPTEAICVNNTRTMKVDNSNYSANEGSSDETNSSDRNDEL